MSRFLFWALALFVFTLSPFIGAAPITLGDIVNLDSLSSIIFFELRLPRTLFAFFAGVILALGGVLFQTIFRNALMTPYTLGVSSGAVLGAGIAIKIGLGTLFLGVSLLNVFGFLGAFGTLLLLLWLSRFLKHSHSESLLLLGIALSLFYTSALMLLFYFGSSLDNNMLLHFTMGSLSIVGWSTPILMGFLALLFTLALYAYKHELSLMAISEESAKLKGVDIKKVSILLLSIASFAIGALVSVAGPIGFVGLITPHIVSKIYPQNISKRVFKTALFGGFFLVFCDMISRAINTQSELPIGIVTAFIGGPFFIYLIITKASK
jgi:iron complex transport system permease protein